MLYRACSNLLYCALRPDTTDFTKRALSYTLLSAMTAESHLPSNVSGLQIELRPQWHPPPTDYSFLQPSHRLPRATLILNETLVSAHHDLRYFIFMTLLIKFPQSNYVLHSIHPLMAEADRNDVLECYAHYYLPDVSCPLCSHILTFGK